MTIETLFDPGTPFPLIARFWAFIAEDANGEGVVGLYDANEMAVLPAIAADQARLDMLRPLVTQWAKRENRPVKVVLFERSTQVDVIEP